MARAAVRVCGLGEAERHEARRKNAKNARVHLLGAAGNPRAAIERRRKCARFVSIELGEHSVNAAGAGGFEHLHHRSHVPFGAGERFEHVGDIGAQVIRGGLRPKWVAFVVFDRANCRCDGDDVLLKGFAVNEAYIGEWVVAHGAAHG